jgi:hypothetical protein
MRKALWIWVAAAFVVGLLPGGIAAWWVRQSSVSTRTQLMARNADLKSLNSALQDKVNSVEASMAALSAKIDQTQAAAQVTPAASASSGTSSSGTPSGAPNITERSVSPAQVSASGKLTLTVKLTGHADKVHMRIANSSGTFDKTYYLARTGTDAKGETWTDTITAPSASGKYTYYGIAYAGTTKYPMAGVSGFTFQVK